MQKIKEHTKLFAYSCLNTPIHSDIEKHILENVLGYLKIADTYRIRSLSSDFNKAINEPPINNFRLKITSAFLSKNSKDTFNECLKAKDASKIRCIFIKGKIFISPFFESITHFHNLEFLRIAVKTPNWINRHLSKLSSLKKLQRIDLSQSYLNDADFEQVPETVKSLIYGYSIHSSSQICDLKKIPHALSVLSVSCFLRPEDWEIIKEKTTDKSSIYLCNGHNNRLAQRRDKHLNCMPPAPDEVPIDIRARVKLYAIHKEHDISKALNYFPCLETIEIEDRYILEKTLKAIQHTEKIRNKPLQIALPKKGDFKS